MRLIIDGPYLAHRSYEAPYNLSNSDGKDSTMIYTFFKSLTKMINERHPSQVLVTWESHGTPSWRRQLLPSYKPEKPILPSYMEQLKDIQTVLYDLAIKQYYSPTNEADDVISMLIDKTTHNLIFTVDKDIFQLVDDSIPVEILCRGIVYNEELTIEKFGVEPNHIPLYLALLGDVSDNIPGIKGIGKVTARKIIKNKTISDLSNFKRKKIDLYHTLTKLNNKGELIELIPKVKRPKDEILEKYELKDFKLERQRRLF